MIEETQLSPIVLIEDNPDDEAMAIRALRRANIANPVKVITDGLEAMNYIKEVQELPALILLDMNLPKVDGFEILAALRSDERTSDLKVVVMLGTETDKEVLRGRGVNESSYIVKPVDEAQFLREVHSLRLRWSLF